MAVFLKINIDLILVISGAIIPFIISAYQKFADKKKTRLIFIKTNHESSVLQIF